MSVIDIQIKKFIKKVRRRMTEQKVLQYAGIGILAGFFVAVICSVIALFVPWYYATICGVAAVLLGLVAGCIIGFIRRPAMEAAALQLDAHGFQERLITAYGLRGKEDIYSNMQKQDTIKRISAFSIRNTFPLKIRWKTLVATLILAGAFAGIACIPTAAKQQAAQYQEIAQQIEEEVEKVEETIEHIEGMEDLSEEEKQEIIGTLSAAIEELEAAGSAEELSKAKERISVIANQEAAKTQYRDVREELQSLADGLSDSEKTESQQLAEDLQDLQQDLQNLSDATSDKDIQAIANELQQLGQKTGNQTMQDAGQQLANNNLSQSELQQAQQAVANEQQTAQAQASSEQASNKQSSGQSGTSGDNTSQDSSGQSTQADSQQGSQSSAGSQDGTQSTEASSGQSGEGSGSDEGSSSQSGENSSGGQSGSGTGYDQGSNQGVQADSDSTGSMVTIPDIEMQENEALDGKVNTNGSAATQKGGQAWSGYSVFYEQVIGSYSQNAYNKVESSNYPKGVQDIVKSYFDDLD